MDFLGKILHINLSTRTSRIENVNKADWMKYLPGRGINAKLLWDLTDENTDPLGQENKLIFGAGGLTGTFAPCSGRTTVTFKSPATNMYFKSNTGGHWGAELKFAGYGHLVIHGKAENPVYIVIKNNKIEIKDADYLWGKDVRETNKLLREDLGDGFQMAAIGPGGENMVRFASIMFSTYNAAARGGIGAVMGSKNLKAIAVKGNKKLKVENDEQYHKLCKLAAESILKDSGAEGMTKYGTSGSVLPINEIHAWPTKNFQKGHFDYAENISGQNLVKSERLKRRDACYSCVIGCHRYCETEGKYKSYTAGPELESFCSLGAGPEVKDLDAVIKANELCNIYGLDTISAGVVIQWAMECFDKGIFTEEETDGVNLIWGNGDAVIEMVERIAYRKGIGDLLAEGVKRAAEKIGKESYKWAVEAKGLEQSGVDTRPCKGYALAFAVNPRGVDHLHTETFAEFGFSEEARNIIKKITEEDEFIECRYTKKRPEIVRWHEDVYAATDALGICSFTNTALYGITPEMMAQLWSEATGCNVSEEELMEAGRRMVTLEKSYNVRCGADRSNDRLPWRVMNEDVEDRLGDEYLANTQEELDSMLNKYYKLHNWDLETSWPKKETLEKLKLEFVEQELGNKNKLP